MITYANQKIIHINSELHNEDHTYGVISRDAISTAARVLNDGTAFTMYIYMAVNQNGFQLALSPKAVKAEIGLSTKQYRRAIKILIDNGFLTQIKEGSTHYHFYEWPAIYKGTVPVEVDAHVTSLEKYPWGDIQFAPTRAIAISSESNTLFPCKELGYTSPRKEPITSEDTEIIQELQDIQNITINNISCPDQGDISASGDEFPIRENSEEDDLLKELLDEKYQEAKNTHDWQIVMYEDGTVDCIPATDSLSIDSFSALDEDDLPF